MFRHPSKATIQTLGHARAFKNGSVKPDSCTLEFEKVFPIILRSGA